MLCLFWLAGGFSADTVYSAQKKELCVFRMMNTVQMFRILSKPLGGKVTGTSECLLCTFWRMPLEKCNSNQITNWHVCSFSTVVFSILVESRFYKWHVKCTVKSPWNPGHVMQSNTHKVARNACTHPVSGGSIIWGCAKHGEERKAQVVWALKMMGRTDSASFYAMNMRFSWCLQMNCEQKAIENQEWSSG